MTYIVRFFTSTFAPIKVGLAPNLAEAKKLLNDGVFQIEEDADNPDHFDGITNHGEVFTITPYKEA
jgi:hypothetical protein